MLKIENPVLRFLAGVVVLGLIVAAAVGVFYGVGSLLEPVYAQVYPALYRELGYRLVDQMVMGLMIVAISCLVVAIFAVAVTCARELGDKFFKPSESGK